MSTAPLFSFGIVADCQYADHADEDAQVLGTDHVYHNRYRLSPQKLREAVDEFNQHKLEFVVHLGDYTDRNLNDSATLDAVAAQLKSPLWHVLGNHDLAGMKGQLDAVVERRSMPASYYDKQVEGFRFIILDTNDLGVIEHEEGSNDWKVGREKLDSLRAAGAPQSYEWNGGVGPEQLAWFEGRLQQATQAGEKVVVFAHHPIFPPGVLNALNDDEIVAVIERYPAVTAYINGHNHIGDFGERAGVPYVTINAMVHTETNAYAIAEVYEDRIELHGYGQVPSRTLDFV